MSSLKKIEKKSYLKFFFLLFCSIYLFLKITDGSDKFFFLIDQLNLSYLILIIIFTLIFILSTVYTNMIIYNKFLKKKLNNNFFFYTFIKSQILSYVFSLIGIFYRYYIFKKKIYLLDFIHINFFIIWFFLFFYLILYSFELLIFGSLFFPFNFYIFFIIILTSTFIFILPKILKVIEKKFLIKLLNNLKFIINKKINFHSYYSYLSIKIFFLGLFSHFFSFLQIFFIVKMLNIPIIFNNLIIFFVINCLLDQLPITPKNIGISEIIFGHLAVLIGLTFDYGVLFKFFLRFFNLSILLILFSIIKLKNIITNCL
jgi:hypothetical protein